MPTPRPSPISLRLSRFALVGLSCFATQVVVMTWLAALGTTLPLANAIGFVVSAQANFGLSAWFTWGDRPARSATRVLARRWLSYQVTAGLALVVNTVTFTVALPSVPPVVAAAAGVVVGSGVTFVVCHFLIFTAAPLRRRLPAEETR